QLLMALVTLLIAGGALFYASRDTDWVQLQVVIQNADYRYLLSAAFFLCLLFPLRGLRWYLLLNANGNLERQWTWAMWGVSVAYLGNMFLPARAGEVLRTVMLGQSEDTNVSYVFATVVVERLLEAVLQIIIFSLLFSFIVDISPLLQAGFNTIVVIGVVSVLGLLLLPQLEKPIRLFLGWLPLGDALQARILAMLAQFILGVKGVQNGRVLVGFIVYTVAITFVEAVALHQTALAFDIQIAPLVVLFLYTSLGLSSALPSTPGALGIYQLVAVQVLQPLGYADEPVLVFITAFQVLVVGLVAIWGMIGLWQLRDV
ncbi:MAG: lysylphosphatidylglycerol synthase transmembrane domain-containing protein, partial [Chloroflexota bacterium]